MSDELNQRLRNLDADGLADVQSAVAREVARRQPRKAVSELSDGEFQKWCDQQIRAAEQAKAAAAQATAEGDSE